MPANAFLPTAVIGEADSVNSVSASACQIGGPKGVSPGQKALLHGILFRDHFDRSQKSTLSNSVYPFLFKFQRVLKNQQLAGGCYQESFVLLAVI